MNQNLLISPEKETKKIISFLQEMLQKQAKQKVVIGISGGVDSATSLYLLKKAIDPKNIFTIFMPYFATDNAEFKNLMQTLEIPQENASIISIKPIVDTFEKITQCQTDPTRLGNAMARVRMMLLFDMSKKLDALVVGTENKSEYHLGYFTRYGDEGSDIEPIRHLYKTQVYQLAKYLQVPQTIIDKQPTAGLWEGQTDEKDFGFSYETADDVLYNYLEKGITLPEIAKTIPDAEKVIQRLKQNSYKHKVPYTP